MKTPIIYQHDEMDCGAASLAMIAQFHGLRLSLAKCRQLIGVDNDGASAHGIRLGAEKIGFNTRILEGNYSELTDALQKKEISFPFIAQIITPIISDHYAEHYIVVFGFKRNKIIVGDPAIGKKYIRLHCSQNYGLVIF